ncbi:hypothetical protein [Candidatus Clostridium stratigraminis]|uniref:Spore coat protein GerQ n=1 Tax=Candidatus Clostridium stratigraminis TaxID=3381661 RepID=A0ABW8TB41_9CLOT
MIPDFYEDCPFRFAQNSQMTPGYIPVPSQYRPMFETGPTGMPILTAGMPHMTQGGNTTMPQNPHTPIPQNPNTPQGPGGSTAMPPFPGPAQTPGTNIPGQNFEMAPGSPIQQDINYTQGYLRTQIGRRMLVSFLIGTSTYQDRTGVLEKVGISYIILKEPEGTELLCDIYSIKFVRIFQTPAQ